MARRLFDLCVAGLGVILASPLLAFAAIGIKLTSRGPLIYPATRVGQNGELFTMYKFRTMKQGDQSSLSAITSEGDARIFPFGRLLRRLKIDELPQLFNIVEGHMSVIGPRPEDPKIVADHYTAQYRETLQVRPGLASPGSLYNYTHGQKLIPAEAPEQHYIAELLPVKMALDRVYVSEQSLWNDLRICLRTAVTIGRYGLGQREFPDPPEMKKIAPGPN